MSDEPALLLFSEGLMSKWGFNDGDAPDDVLDYCEEHGLGDRIGSWRSILAQLVSCYLLPALDQKVTVVQISCNHNPIRAETVDGVDVTDFWYSEGGPELTPECVKIPMAEVARLVQDAQ